MVGTSGNDTFNAAAGTFAAGDVVVDNSTTDNDTLNITSATAVAAVSVAKIENINVTNTAFTGAAFDAANVINGRVTGNLSQLGADGAFTISNVGSTAKAIAGTGVTALTATVVGSGAQVDAGAATAASVNGVATTAEAATVYVNGNVALTTGATGAGVIDTLTINATKDAVVTLTGSTLGAKTDVAGAGNATLKGASSIFAGKTITQTGAGTMAVEFATTLASADLTKVEADNFILGVDAGAATSLIVKTGATVTVGTALVGTNDVTITEDIATAATNKLNVVLKAAATDLAVTNVKTVNLSSTAATTATTATAVTAANFGTADVVITGDKNITFATSLVAGSVDGSAATGNIAITTATLKGAKTGAGIDSFASTVADAVSVTMGAGVDTVTMSANNTSLTADMGDGNDVVDVSTATAKALTIDGGAGADKVMLDDVSYVGTTLSLTNVEQLEILSTSTTLGSSVLSGKSYVISVAGATAVTAGDLVVEMDNLSVDLSSLVSDGVGATIQSSNITGVSLAMTGTAYADVITGGSKADTLIGGKGDDAINGGDGADSIEGGEGSDTLTGGLGADVIVTGAGNDTVVINLDNANGGTETTDSGVAAFDKVTDFDITKDVLSLNDVDTGGTAAALVKAADSTGATTTANTVDITILNGVVTQITKGDGTLANKLTLGTSAEVDTLAEVVAILTADTAVTNGSAVAFEFGGNTYVFGTGNAGDAKSDTLVQLTGVTSITSLTDAAGIFTLA
jgi:hypothetical protein